MLRRSAGRDHPKNTPGRWKNAQAHLRVSGNTDPLRANISYRAKSDESACSWNGAGWIDAEITDLGIAGLNVARRTVCENGTARVDELGQRNQAAVASLNKPELKHCAEEKREEPSGQLCTEGCGFVHPGSFRVVVP